MLTKTGKVGARTWLERISVVMAFALVLGFYHWIVKANNGFMDWGEPAGRDD